MVTEVSKLFGASNKPNVHFYKINLALSEEVEALWNNILKMHGPIHILVNNAAICNGRSIKDLSLKQFKLTMDINFISYVQMSMLFLQQKQIKNCNEHQFHIVNVSSIAGHLTSSRNSDYASSKFALTGFADTLRQELGWNSPIVLTNFYPYFINTGLFEGFKPKLRFILPTLDAHAVAA